MTKGPAQGQPLLDPRHHREPRGGPGRDRPGPQGPELLHDERVLERRARHRRGDRVDPPRQGRRHGRGRRRGDDHARRHRRLRGDARALQAQRRSGAREPARSTRGATASSAARARGILVLESLTRAKKRGATIYAEVTGLRRVERRATTSRSPRRTHEGAQRAMRMALEDAQRRARRGRLRERARNVDAHRRRRGVARHRRGVRRERDRQEALGELDQVDDGPPARRRRRGRDGDLRARDRARGTSRRPSTSSTRIPSARSTTWPNTARERRLRHAMNNSFGFGGTNCALVLSRFDG